MAFEIRLDRNVPREIRRIVREQIDLAITGLNYAREGHPEGIHTARKSFKAIRAVLRLVPDHLGNYYGRENLWYRNTARKLATVRDAQANLETLDRLTEVERPGLRTGRVDELRTKLQERSMAIHREQLEDAETIDGLVEDLVRARERVRRWALPKEGFGTVAHGLTSTYERGRRGFRRSRSGVEAPELHEWRKHVKYHRHHIRMLKDLWPEVMLAASATLKELSDLLGNHHDLHVFRTLIASSSNLVRGKKDRGVLLGAAENQSMALERRVLVIGGLVYAEKPRRFAARMAAYWASSEAGQSNRNGAAGKDKGKGRERGASSTTRDPTSMRSRKARSRNKKRSPTP